MISTFTTSYPEFDSLKADLQASIATHESDDTSHDLLLNIQHLVAEVSALDKFLEFVEAQCRDDKTWQLWYNFVFQDCFSYIGLFIAIRTSDWELRMSSLKRVVPLFCAYDRPCYQRLIPNHIACVHNYPAEIIDSFKKGGFTVKVKGGIGHAVAIDEAHEMLINRDMKMAVARPTTPYLKKTTHFFHVALKHNEGLHHSYSQTIV